MKKILLMLIILLLLLSTYPTKALGKKLYFIEKDNKIIYENSEEDIFMRHLDMLPGSSYVDELEIENGTKNKYTLFLKIEEIPQSEEAIELLNSIEMKLYLDGELIYNGNIKGLDYQENNVNLQNAVLLKEFQSNDKSLLKVETKLSEDYSNKNNNDLSKINWVFYAQYENNEPVIIDGVPKTDTNNNLTIILAAIVLSIGIGAILYSQKKK